MRAAAIFSDGSHGPQRAGLLCSALLALAAAGCPDPAVDAQIAALGPEAAGVAVGPLHRPNQPCVVCHQEAGNAAAFVFGGTVYFDATGSKAVGGVEVALLDAAGRVHRTVTNCAGNFFVRPGEWQPTFPVWATLVAGEHSIDMESPIYREGSCSNCHQTPAGPRSAGQVFLSDDPDMPVALPPSNCGARP